MCQQLHSKGLENALSNVLCLNIDDVHIYMGICKHIQHK